jgi:betaine-aldehyde dehydrogenase
VTGAGHGAIVRDEVFGPALAVYHAQRATSAIRAGCVRVNDHIPIISEMPHRGTKESGFGKDTSTNSFDEQAVAKPVMYDRTGVAQKPWHRTVFAWVGDSGGPR